MDKGPNNIHVVVLALAQLGGATKKVHSENIAARSFELAPAQFSWRSPQFREKGWPDKYVAAKALEDAKKKKNGCLVQGNYALQLAKDGWQLTPAGSEWIVKNEQRIAAGLAADRAEIPKRDAQRFCRNLKTDPLFKKFAHSGHLDDSSRYEFTDLLECSPDASRETVQHKLQRLLSAAHVVRDEEILSFLDVCKSRYSELLGSQVDDPCPQSPKPTQPS